MDNSVCNFVCNSYTNTAIFLQIVLVFIAKYTNENGLFFALKARKKFEKIIKTSKKRNVLARFVLGDPYGNRTYTKIGKSVGIAGFVKIVCNCVCNYGH